MIRSLNIFSEIYKILATIHILASLSTLKYYAITLILAVIGEFKASNISVYTQLSEDIQDRRFLIFEN
ncbi:hypothetical protein HZS_7530 [Henneguya salminicola]|nr:hypothetical protein HZS_7530 [Henneguya salminicola]